MHAWAARVQVAGEQGSGGEWLGPGPLHQTFNVLGLEFFRCPAARHIR